MKIFICGLSRSGKTHLAQLLSNALDLKFVSASGWLSKIDEVLAVMATDETEQEYIERLTQRSIEALDQDPDICIRWINKNKYDIIEGVRNPRDFAHLYNPSEDVIIWCVNKNVVGPATEFERAGACAILNYIEFQKNIHPKLKMVKVEHNGPPDGLEQQLDSILERLGAKKVWKLK